LGARRNARSLLIVRSAAGRLLHTSGSQSENLSNWVHVRHTAAHVTRHIAGETRHTVSEPRTLWDQWHSGTR